MAQACDKDFVVEATISSPCIGKKSRARMPLELDLMNWADDEESLSYRLDEAAYRQQELTIGYDFLRFEGVSVARGEIVPSNLQISEIVGQGAFSTVRHAKWIRKGYNDTKTTSVDVAIKECPLLESSPQRRRMLLQELRALCSVKSTSLVQLHGAFLQHADDACSHHTCTVTMVLEFMDKGSLEDLLTSFKLQNPAQISLPEVVTAAITYQILNGLVYLHAPERRMIHRDLKPANVLLHSDGTVKLCDFGMTTLLQEGSMSRTVLGTTHFMAPERLRALPYGRPSDIWSLGLIVWGCATGEPTPWFGTVNSIIDLLVTIEEKSIVDILEMFINLEDPGIRRTNMSKELQQILVGCLHLESRKRIPAQILIQSPWFSVNHQVSNRKDAVKCVRHFLSQA